VRSDRLIYSVSIKVAELSTVETSACMGVSTDTQPVEKLVEVKMAIRIAGHKDRSVGSRFAEIPPLNS
jgi:hypothetical protein